MKTAASLEAIVVTVTTLVALVLANSPRAVAATSAALEIEQLSARAHSQFLAGEFAALDSRAEDLRRTKARFSDGRWKIGVIYDGFVPARGGDEGRWARTRELLEQWRSETPRSPTPHVALASHWLAYAWKARGTGYAHTVTEEGWKQFHERLAKARDILESSRDVAARCPMWHHVMLRVAKGQGWDVDVYDRAFDAAVSQEPDFLDYYFEKANYMLPRWHGAPGDLAEFVEQSVARTKDRLGYELYARIYWAVLQSVGIEPLRNGEIDWRKMRQGFLDMERTFPDVWNRNAFAYYACEAGDATTAREVIERLGEPELSVWRSQEAFERCKAGQRATPLDDKPPTRDDRQKAI